MHWLTPGKLNEYMKNLQGTWGFYILNKTVKKFGAYTTMNVRYSSGKWQ